jgi:hypothetical protein
LEYLLTTHRSVVGRVTGVSPVTLEPADYFLGARRAKRLGIDAPERIEASVVEIS